MRLPEPSPNVPVSADRAVPRLAGLALLLAALVAGLAPVVVAQERSAPRPAGVCIGCGRTLEGGGVVLHHRGRRVPLCSPCEEVWEADPEGMFARLSPRSALFQEHTDPPPTAEQARSPWFWLGVYVVAGLVCSALAAYLAVDRGSPPLGWFFAGLFGNVAALAVLLFVVPRGESAVPRGLVKVPLTHASRPCPGCAAPLHPAAGACPACGAAVEPLVESEVGRPGRSRGR